MIILLGMLVCIFALAIHGHCAERKRLEAICQTIGHNIGLNGVCVRCRLHEMVIWVRERRKKP